MPQFIHAVNTLYESAVVNAGLRRELIYTKAQLEGERQKQKKASDKAAFYQRKLERMTQDDIKQ